MAIPQNTLIGKTKNSVGGTTFSSWKGINVLKSKAVQVANPRTEPQVNQRARMTAIIRVYQGAPAAIKEAESEQAVRQSAYNAFVKENLHNTAVTAVGGVASIDASLIEISKGSIQNATGLSATGTTGATSVTVSFDSATSGNQKSTDKVQVVILSSDGVVLGSSSNAATRADGTVTVSLDHDKAITAGSRAVVAFVDTSLKKSDNSQNIEVA